MRVRDPNNVGRAVQTFPTLLPYASAITEQKNVGSCWLKSLTSFKLCATTPNNIQQGLQTDATCNIQQCWELLTNDVAIVCTEIRRLGTINPSILSFKHAFFVIKRPYCTVSLNRPIFFETTRSVARTDMMNL